MIIRVKDENWDVKEVNIRANKMLLEELEEAGYDIPNACKIGTCGACMCQVNEGAEFIDNSGIREAMFPLDDTEVLTCTAVIKPEAEASWKVIELELE